MKDTFTARQLYTANGRIDYPSLSVEDGLITGLEAGAPNDSAETWAAPFFDIHVHGAMTHDFMVAAPDQVDEVGRFLASRGVAFYLPTTVTGPLDHTLRALQSLARKLAAPTPEDAATPVALHLEGPFLCPAKRGVHPPQHLLPPSVAQFQRFQEAADGHIRLITMAPEMPGALELIAHAVRSGVRVSLGHSNATAAQTLAAVELGASSATHTFNAMRELNHREPGIAGAVLDSEALYAEAIVDGVHLHPAIVRLWFAAKGLRKAILVTDGMSATGMPDGTYMLGELTVEVRDGVCLSEGVLAGSVLTMDRAVQNLREMTGASLAAAVQLASHNPAAMLGRSDLLQCTPGSPANFSIFDAAGRRCGSFLNGKRLRFP